MAKHLELLLDQLATPLGPLFLVVDRDGCLRAADFGELDGRLCRLLQRQYGPSGYILQPATNPGGFTQALHAYFTGQLSAIDGLPVANIGTPFQRTVWRALRDIPCGTTVSYGELARRIGSPKAVRAVGLANGANPISLVVPCHRVIGANGSLTGYGAGIERKRWLLAHERAS